MSGETPSLDPQDESQWLRFRHEFRVRTDTVYLNHGSFGIALNGVRHRRDQLMRELETQPMDFYLRRYEPLLTKARQRLAEFVGTEAQNLGFVDNATWAMNLVANSIELAEGDEVLMTDQEYEPVNKIWGKKCDRQGASLVEVTLPESIESNQQIVDLILSKVSEKTKIVVFSHILSTSAVIMPAKEICSALRERNVLSCVDGPHAILQIDLKLNALGCDFYCASLHKWLCAPLGTGFVFVRPERGGMVDVPVTSWGRLGHKQVDSWDEKLMWLGTRNQTGALAVPEAIDFFAAIGFENVRNRMQYLASVAENKLTELLDEKTIAPRSEGFYGSMAHVPLPKEGRWSELQDELWVQEGIEVPIRQLNDRWWIRVSCHLYNSPEQIELLTREIELRL